MMTPRLRDQHINNPSSSSCPTFHLMTSERKENVQKSLSPNGGRFRILLNLRATEVNKEFRLHSVFLCAADGFIRNLTFSEPQRELIKKSKIKNWFNGHFIRYISMPNYIVLRLLKGFYSFRQVGPVIYRWCHGIIWAWRWYVRKLRFLKNPKKWIADSNYLDSVVTLILPDLILTFETADRSIRERNASA